MNKNISSILAAAALGSSLVACGTSSKEELPPQDMLTKELTASVQDGTAEIICQRIATTRKVQGAPIIIKGSDVYSIEYPNFGNNLKIPKAQKLPEMTIVAQNSKDALLAKRFIRKTECGLDF